MRGILRTTAVVTVTGLAWIPGTSAAQGFTGESSASLAVGASLWNRVGVGLAVHATSLPPRTPAPAAEVFHGVGVSDRYHVDAYPDHDDFGPRCRWYAEDHLHGWIDRHDYSVHRCRRRVSRWGLAVSFGFGWHYPGYARPWFAWRDPFWSPWYSFDPWFGPGWLAFGYPAYYGYPVHYGYSPYYSVPRLRHMRGNRLTYGSGYARPHATGPAVRYKENPRRTAVARTARVAPRTAGVRSSDRPAATASPTLGRRPGRSARPRMVRPEPRTSATARPRGTGSATDAVRPGARTATPRIQTQSRPDRYRSQSDAISVRPRTSPGSSVQPPPSAPRAQPRASTPPNVRTRPSVTPRVRPRASAPSNVRSRSNPTLRTQPRSSAPRVQSRPGNPRPQPRASASPNVRSRPTPPARASARPARPPRRPPGGP